MTRSFNLRAQLAQGRHALDVARAPQIAHRILAEPRLAAQLVELLWDDDPGVANRAADALERASFHRPELLVPWKSALLGLLPEARFNKLRWNLAFVVGRIPLSVPQARRAASTLQTWLDDRSSIVKTAALHCLADLTRSDPSLLPDVLDILRTKGRSGTPAMRARSRILLKKLERPPAKSPFRK
ncbi:MAG: hypothetical protein WBD67_01950 [Terracidiphilus sp.]